MKYILISYVILVVAACVGGVFVFMHFIAKFW